MHTSIIAISLYHPLYVNFVIPKINIGDFGRPQMGWSELHNPVDCGTNSTCFHVLDGGILTT